jgi:hypothetical protein
VYDPDQTGTGGQPVNYDDFAAHYLRYRVIASRITVVAYSPSSTTSGVQNFVLYPYNSSAATDIPTAAGQPYAISTVVHPMPTVVSAFAKTEKIVGRNPRTSDALAAQYNADPADIWRWGLVAQTIDGSSTSTSYYGFTIDYDVEFFDRLVTGLDERIDRLLKLQQMKAVRAEQRRAKQLDDSKESSYELVEARSALENALAANKCATASFAPQTPSMVVRLNSRASSIVPLDVHKGQR